jgi:hypothetical protein
VGVASKQTFTSPVPKHGPPSIGGVTVVSTPVSLPEELLSDGAD